MPETAGVSGPLGQSAPSNPGNIVLNGGTLQYSASNANDYSGRFSAAANQAYNVDTNGQNVAWATALTSAGGTLTLSDSMGTGSLTLGAANPLGTSAGVVIDNGGTLIVINQNGLFGSGTTLPPLTINAGGTATTGVAGVGLNVGNVDLNGGTLASAAPSTTNGSWDLYGTVTVNGGATTSTISATGVVLANSAGNTFNVNAGSTPNGVDLDVTGTITTATSITDDPLIKTGTGVMSLDGNNNYNTATTISGGTLRVGNGGTTGTLGTGAVTDNASLVFDRSDSVTVSLAINGAGAVTQAGSGTLILNGTNVYLGGTIMQAGVLQASANGLGAGKITFTGGSFRYATGNTTDYSNRIANSTGPIAIDFNSQAIVYNDTLDNTNTGGFTVSSSAPGGSLTLNSTGAYTGPTNVNSGKLTLAAGSGLANTAITVAAGAAFAVHNGSFSTTIGNSDTPSAGASLTLDPGSGAAGGGSFDMVDGAIGTFYLQQGSSFGPGLVLGGTGAAANAPSLSFELDSNNVGSADRLIVTNGATVNSGSGQTGASISIIQVAGAASLAFGDYTIITADGGLGTGFSIATPTINVNGTAYGVSLSHSTATAEIITIGAATPFPDRAYFNGSQSANWSTVTGAGPSTNWLTDNTGATGGTLLAISGIIAGSGANRSVTLTGGGILTLSNSNTYNGGTTIYAGTLRTDGQRRTWKRPCRRNLRGHRHAPARCE